MGDLRGVLDVFEELFARDATEAGLPTGVFCVRLVLRFGFFFGFGERGVGRFDVVEDGAEAVGVVVLIAEGVGDGLDGFGLEDDGGHREVVVEGGDPAMIALGIIEDGAEIVVAIGGEDDLEDAEWHGVSIPCMRVNRLVVGSADGELCGAEDVFFFFGALDVQAFGAMLGPVCDEQIGGVGSRVGADEVVVGITLGGGEP